MSNRRMDMRGEKAMGVFLDKYFYPKLEESNLIDSHERIYNIRKQKRGIDVILSDEENVDEKTQLYYINNPLDTFIFEIEFYHKGMNRFLSGWYLNPDNLTDFYAFIWINDAKTTMINRLVSEDFNNVEVCIISKNRAKEYFNKLNCSDSFLKEKAHEMREKSLKRVDVCDGAHMTLSMKFEEQPINLVVNKETLLDMCEGDFIVTKEKVERIK